MGQKSQALAEQFEQANRQMTATIERCSDAQWKTKTSGETWPVGVVAHHVAQSHEGISGLVHMIATGQQLPPMTMDMINQGNAEHAKKFANVTREETLALLKKNGAAAASAVRGLSDEQLDRSAPVLGGSPMTAQQVIERILIGHVKEHHGSIQAVVGAK
jgi:uncharacterized damage-inducible protein DinB